MENKTDNTTTDVAVVVRVLETTPAVVNFNYQEIADHLDLVLEKYKGLVFTENTVTDCKKTIAELRKGQKSLDEFRKATKKQLTESVTAFENQCKTLYGKFDEVIQPLTLQNEQFELNRRAKKRVDIQGVIDSLVAELTLDTKYASQLVIPEEYFNKGKSMKGIKTELTTTANLLSIRQSKEKQDIDLIKTKVELANAQYQLTNILMPDSYLRLLAHHSVVNIESMITADAEQTAEREKKAAEVPILKAVIPETPEPIKVTEFVQPTAVNVSRPEPSIVPAPPASAPSESKKITVVYEITGTEEQLLDLEVYLDDSGLGWIDRP